MKKPANTDGRHGREVHSLDGRDHAFRTFLECIHEGAVTLDEDGRIVYVNRFLAAVLERPAESLIGDRLVSAVVPECRPTFDELLNGALSGAVTKGSSRLQARNETVPVQLTLSPLTGTGARFCCGIVFDVRGRDGEHANTLSAAVDGGSESKYEFLAQFSHDLRSPLSTILGWAQLLAMREDLDDKARRGVQAIERSARAQTKLIAELLERIPPRPERPDLGHASGTRRLQTSRHAPALEPAHDEQSARLGGVRVLLIDDESDSLDLARHVLESEGAEVCTAQSASAALKALNNGSFSVLVSDIGLPEQDGFTLMREVRARGHTKRALPAIALTGFAGRDHARLASAAGFQLQLAKPVDMRELVNAIARLSGRSAGPAIT